eukprot:gb/GFBE01069332.1/.p1 GENE.gb/GFBE01069332.1/~~gb/GFBE01069332.1/.p1  ORF type:complete len:122 (+),score=13.66 gb/GFBE01069332.1/:1-366(+)
MHALRAGSSLSIVRCLLDAYADPAFRDASGGSAMHYAAAHGDNSVDAVSELLKDRAEVNAEDQRGATALALAALRGAPLVVRLLLSSGASPQHCRGILSQLSNDVCGPDGRSCRDILARVL